MSRQIPPELPHAIEERWCCCAHHSGQKIRVADRSKVRAAVGFSRIVIAESFRVQPQRVSACKLPQRGRVESLNVAQACTVMCYEWLRREMCGEGTRGV